MDLRIFRNQAFGEVRVADIGGRPMFAAGDVARALGYANPRDAVAKHCKGVAKCDIPYERIELTKVVKTQTGKKE